MEMDISDIVEEIKQAYDYAYKNFSISTQLICSNPNASEEEIETVGSAFRLLRR